MRCRPARTPALQAAPRIPGARRLFVDSFSDQPPGRGFFRTWGRLYGALLAFTLLIWVVLLLFSRAFRGP